MLTISPFYGILNIAPKNPQIKVRFLELTKYFSERNIPKNQNAKITLFKVFVIIFYLSLIYLIKSPLKVNM